MVTSPKGALRFEFSIQGDVEMQNTLRRLGNVVSEKILRTSLKEGAKVLTRAARANLRRRGTKRTGQLAASIGTRVKLYSHSGTAVAIWGVRRGMAGERARLAHLVEFGHKMVLFGRETGDEVQPHPFLTPAWESKRMLAIGIAMNVLAAQVRAAAAKMGVKFR